MQVQLECQECGKSFTVPHWRKDKAKYCSKECADGHRNDKRVIPKEVLRCKYCGKRFEEHQCHAGRRTYCSNECRFADPKYKVGQRDRVLGKRNPVWTGGISAHPDGYLYEISYGHPFATPNGRVLQHRLVMERHLRARYPEMECLVKLDGELYLSPDYVVHHRNRIREDNQIENLLVMTQKEHRRLHATLNNPNVKT